MPHENICPTKQDARLVRTLSRFTDGALTPALCLATGANIRVVRFRLERLQRLGLVQAEGTHPARRIFRWRVRDRAAAETWARAVERFDA